MRYALLFLYFPIIAVASEPKELNSDSSRLAYTHTSDQISQTEFALDYQNHRRDLFWPHDLEAPKAQDFGFTAHLFNGQHLNARYQGERVAFGIGNKFSSDWLTHFFLGAHFFNNLSVQKKNTTPYLEGELFSILSPTLEMHLKLNHDFIYQDFVQPSGVDSAITANSLFLNLTYKPISVLRSNLITSFKTYSDSNNKRDLDASLLYGIATSTPWIWVGLGAEFLSYSSHQQGYWSPAPFYSYGPRFEGVFPIFDHFELATGLNLNHFSEDSTAIGNGYYGTFKLQYGTRNTFNLYLEYIRIIAEQNSRQWFSNSLAIGANISL